MGALRVTILGSGTCVPSLERSASAVLVEADDTVILLDAGVGTMRRLLEAGITIDRITHLFFSHLHPDHTGEFVPLLFALKYPELTRRSGKLTIAGGKGFKAFHDGLGQVYGDWIDLGEDMVEILEITDSEPAVHSFGSFDITTLPMNHIASSLGYRITVPEGIAIVFTGDTDYCENAVELARDADLLICESSLPDEMKAPGHLTPSLAGKIATEAGVEHLVLTHFYPHCDRVDIEGQCRRTYDGDLALARDLMSIELS